MGYAGVGNAGSSVIAYNYLVAQVAGTTLNPVYEMGGQTLTLDFQGNSDALFVFQVGSTLISGPKSKIVAINTGAGTSIGSNVYWAVGSSATIYGSEFLGSVIAFTAITMTSAGNAPPVTNVVGRMFALGASVTMVDSNIFVNVDGTVPPPPDEDECEDFVPGGIRDGEFWGQLSFVDPAPSYWGIKRGNTLTAL